MFELTNIRNDCALDEIHSLIKTTDLQKINEKTSLRIHAACVRYCDSIYIDPDKTIDPKTGAALEEIVDEIAHKEHALIRPSHDLHKYSLTRKITAINKKHDHTTPQDCALKRLNDESETRAFEIVMDYHSDNTRTALDTFNI